MLRTVAFKLSMACWYLLWSPILLLILPSKKLTRIVITMEARGVLWLAKNIAKISYNVHFPAVEIDGIPTNPHGKSLRFDGKSIIAAKHMSIMEVAILETMIPNSFFIVKRELLWIPIYGWAFWRMGLQPVNRARGATNMKELAEKVRKKIMKGGTLIIFPEGTRTKPGKRGKLKRGLLFIAETLKLPILPVGTDTGLYWPKRGKTKPGTANVYFEPLLPFNASLEEIGDAINKQSA